MTITFRIIKPQELPYGQESHITFDTMGGKIGRSQENNWVLVNDFVSKEHATIQYQEKDGYYFSEHSRNGTNIQHVNQSKIDCLKYEKRKLNQGDVLYIGDYDIEVSIQEEVISSPPDIEKPEPMTDPTLTQSENVMTQIEPVSERLLNDIQEPIRAFLEGAELTNIPINELDPNLMRTLGKIFIETMEGLIKLIEARKRFKFENDLMATTFKKDENNPLKVNQDPHMVMKTMLLKEKGYLTMLESVKEAFEEIEAHLLAMGGGITGSLANTLELFSPKEIEKRIEKQSKWFNQDSKKWKEFVKRYDELEVNQLLSDELARSYKDQIDRLKNHRS